MVIDSDRPGPVQLERPEPSPSAPRLTAGGTPEPACGKLPNSLPLDRLERIKQRIRNGYYRTPEAVKLLAQRLLASGEL